MFFKFDRYTQSSFGQYRVQTAAANNTFGSNYRLNRYNTPTDNLAADSILEEWLPKSAQMLNRLFRNIHKFDSIAGPAVDLISIMPFSDVTLIGVEDPKILEVYEQSLAELHIETLLPEIACEYLVIGRVIGSLLFDKTKGIWTDIILQDPDFCDITNIPLRGYDPKIDLKLSEDFKKFLLSRDPRDLTAKQEMPEDFLKLLLSADRLPLDPASTLYLPRKTFPNDYLGSSVYYRVLPFYALEKTLINGTLVGAKRRQRSILHVTVGEPDVWEPDEEEISSIAGMFMRADEDPQGAIVATRNGVLTNEVRSGADFWKLSDEWDFLSAAKMRALGINEAFLCITGDSFITTENGLISIDRMGIENGESQQNIDVKVMSRENKVGTAVKWIYRGMGDTISTTTKRGRVLRSTKEHNALVLNRASNLLEWKSAGALIPGDLLCVNTSEYVRKTPLLLNLPSFIKNVHATCLKAPQEPQYMTPELAFILGLIVSEGHLNKHRVCVINSDIKLLDRYEECVQKVFNLICSREKTCEAGEVFEIKGIKTQSTKDCYSSTVESMVLISWLIYLGLTDKISAFKTVPWSVLETDENSQLAYLAACVEGDGSFQRKGKSITFISKSRKNLQQLQALLSTHGILSHLSQNRYYLALDVRSSLLLYERIEKYLVSKQVQLITDIKHRNGTYGGRRFGIPVKGFRDFLLSRKIKTTGLGASFLNDEGQEVFIAAWGVIDKSRWNTLMYDSYEKGTYKKFLDALQLISKREHEKLINLFQYRYYFDEVLKNNENAGKEKLYDLSMGIADEPAFVANGLVIHNSGDATYNCNVFNTLLITEKGILKLGEIANQEIAEAQDISLRVASVKGAEEAVKWIYSGYADTLKLTTDLGSKIEGTPNHPILVLKDNRLDWKMLKDVQSKDLVCASTKVLVRKEVLPLYLIDIPEGKKALKKPTYMTPELAFLIGCVVSEGSMLSYAVHFSNSNLVFAERYITCLEKVFGLDRSYIKKVQTAIKGDRLEIKGNQCIINQDCYDFIFYSKTIMGWLEQLGLYVERNQEKSASHYKVVPWSVLQADEQSQLAYLAAYLEGDGVVNSRITYFSVSTELLQQTQVMLSAHGIVSRKLKACLEVYSADSLTLWEKLKPYMVSKVLTPQTCYKAQNRFGFATNYLKSFLKERQVKQGTRIGTLFTNDQGKQVLVQGWRNVCTSDTCFLYDKFDKGDYNQFLRNLKQISEIEYTKLIYLFETRYFFTAVKNVVDNGKRDVYDISMKPGTEPAFVANGLVVHNTLEAALSIFIESLRNFRDSLVSRIFYEKLFPILAEIHGFKRRTQAELDHKIRIESRTTDSSLIIPQFNFHKQLRPEADTTYLEVLSTMEEKGIPVPLRTWAAAGGLNLEKLLDMKDEDIENRKDVQEWKDEVAKETGGAEPGAGGGEEGAPPKEGGAWGSLINARVDIIRKSLDSLPIWINNRFCGVSKDKFVSILKAQYPSKKLIALYKNSPKQLEAANYVLHRMGVNQLPFNISAARDVADFLKRCGAVYSPHRMVGEFTFLNKAIQESSQKVRSTSNNKRMEGMLPASMGKQLYSGSSK